jgi:homoserine kinase
MNKLKPITAFAPATVANVSCGFDIMGFAIDAIGDRVTIELAPELKESVVIMSGPYGHLIPTALEKNTASVALAAFLKAVNKQDLTFRISLEKNMPLGSGMGSSASSSAAAVFAVNHLLGNLLTTNELIPFAMEGERVASGSAHADNVAPSLLGGFVLIRSYDPLDIISIPCPKDLFCSVVHPQIELHTADARRILQRDIPMHDVIKQTANSAGFMVGLLSKDFDLIGRSMSDLLAEPRRNKLIPGFEEARKAAMEHGALGCGISGSGPSIFTLSIGEESAKQIAQAMSQSFLKIGLASESFTSSMNVKGARIV